MMQQLIELGTELEFALREFFGAQQFGNAVRGVSLDVDDYWEHSELFYNQKGSRDFPMFYPFDYYEYRNRYDRQNNYWQLIREYRKNPYYKTDFSYRPRDWQEHCLSMGYPENSSPVIVRVTLLEDKYYMVKELPRQFNEQYPIIYERKTLNKAVKTSNPLRWLSKGFNWLRGIPENRAPAIARINPVTHGTAGGILEGVHTSGTYIVSCAHVMGKTGTSIHKKYAGGKQIAQVVHHAIPPLCHPADPCSEVTDPQLRSIDVAIAQLTVPDAELFEMGTVTIPNKIAAVSEIRKNDRVTFTGKVSGLVEARIGKLTLWDQVNFIDGVRCFGRVFELKPVDRQYVRQALAKPGDSGSMVVLKINDVVTWYGIVFSCDGGEAYACFAEYIMADSRNYLPEPLKCFS